MSWLCGRRDRWDDLRKYHWNMYITICKTDDQCKYDTWSKSPKVGALGQPRGIRWEQRWEEVQDGVTYVYPWLIHVDVWWTQVLVTKSFPTLATPWAVAHQAPLSMGFCRQEYWSGLPFPSPEDLLNPGNEHSFLHCRHILYHLGHQGKLKKGHNLQNLGFWLLLPSIFPAFVLFIYYFCLLLHFFLVWKPLLEECQFESIIFTFQCHICSISISWIIHFCWAG